MEKPLLKRYGVSDHFSPFLLYSRLQRADFDFDFLIRTATERVCHETLRQSPSDPATRCDCSSTIRVRLIALFPSLPFFSIEAHSIQLLPRVVLKKQELAYGIEAVFRDHVPALMHGNDGLIFTSAESPYTPGTDPKMFRSLSPSLSAL